MQNFHDAPVSARPILGILSETLARTRKVALADPSLETIDKICTALGADKDEARLAAGYAPLSLIPGKPQSLSDLLAALERIGIEGIQFFDQDALARSTPDELAEVLKAVELAVQITLRRQQLPFNDRPTPDTDRSGRRE